MKVDHIVPYIGEEASGPTYSVPQLCQALVKYGSTVTLHVLGPVPKNDFNFTIASYSRCKLPHPRFGRSPDMKKGLIQAAININILHNHSLWMMPNIYPASVLKGTRCRLVTSPRGTLSEYALNRSPWLKKAVWVFGQGDVLRHSACLHATAELEYREIRRKGLRAPVAIIPNGIEIPPERKQKKNF